MSLLIKDGNGSDVYLGGSGNGLISDPFVPEQSVQSGGPQSVLITQRLDETGDGSGNDNMAVDGSGTPVEFKIKPAAGQIMMIARLIFYIESFGTMDTGAWGNGLTLVNGQISELEQDGIVIPGMYPTFTHGDLAAQMHDVEHRAWGAGNEFITGRLTFTKSGAYVRLVGDTNDELRWIIRDNLSVGVAKQMITCQGYWEQE